MMKKKIREFVKNLGIEKIGFSEDAVVALFPYFVKGETGNVSMYARGMDYHTVCEEKLKKLANFLTDMGASETLVHVDKGHLDDRRAAFDAGLGFFGKNGMLICEEYGSYFFIGQVRHNLDIGADSPRSENCLSCDACLKNCPGGALSAEGFTIEKCLSEITQKKGELTETEKQMIRDKGFCWGCDVCQSVCPHNRELETTAMTEFMTDRVAELRTEDVDNLSNREFKEKYGKYAFSWRGKKTLERNLKVLSEKE